MNECAVLKRLNNPHIVKLYEVILLSDAVSKRGS